MLIMAANGFTDGLDQAWANTAEFIPKFIGFLVILFIGYIVAKTVATIVDKVLERVGFDRAVERGGIKKALENSKLRRLIIGGQGRLLHRVPPRSPDGVRGVRDESGQ